MIQGLLLYDDSLIIKGVSEKKYSIKPRIEITISYIELGLLVMAILLIVIFGIKPSKSKA